MNRATTPIHLLPPDGSSEEVPDWSCTSCNAAKVAGAKFCPECGRDLAHMEANQEARPPDPVPSTPAAVAQGPAVFAAISNGQPCETVNPPVPGIGQLSPSANQGVSTTPRTCRCGRSIGEDARFCAGCGVAVDEVADAGLWLTCVDSQGQTSSRLLGHDPVVIGKGGDCDLVLADDEYVSRRHARISQDGDLIMVEDLASRNGTLLKICRPILVEPGDEILVGTCVVRLEKRGN